MDFFFFAFTHGRAKQELARKERFIRELVRNSANWIGSKVSPGRAYERRSSLTRVSQEVAKWWALNPLGIRLVLIDS